jgi:hypothetical protein
MFRFISEIKLENWKIGKFNLCPHEKQKSAKYILSNCQKGGMIRRSNFMRSK